MGFDVNSVYKRFGSVPRSGGFRMSDHWVWGSSVVVGEDGRYHMFASRIPRHLPFHPGWMIASEIVRASSDSPEGPYCFEEVVLSARGAEYWDGRSAHNPRILKHEGKYILFYMGSTHPFEEVESASQLTLDSKWCIAARSNKRIGIAVSDCISGTWERMDTPILTTRPDSFYSFLTSNPAPFIEDDGKVFLIFKSRCYEGDRHGEMNIGLAVASHYRGPYNVVNEAPLFSRKQFGVIEDPFLWKDSDGFHLLAKDQHGTIGKEKGGGILAHSPDCLNWALDEHPVAYSKEIRWKEGGHQYLGNMERCSGLIENGELTHLFFAVWEGKGGFSNPEPGDISWNMSVPLERKNS